MGLMLTPLPLLMLVNLIKRLGTKKTVVIDYQKFFVRKDEPLELVCCFLYCNTQISVSFLFFIVNSIGHYGPYTLCINWFKFLTFYH